MDHVVMFVQEVAPSASRLPMTTQHQQCCMTSLSTLMLILAAPTKQKESAQMMSSIVWASKVSFYLSSLLNIGIVEYISKRNITKMLNSIEPDYKIKVFNCFLNGITL